MLYFPADSFDDSSSPDAHCGLPARAASVSSMTRASATLDTTTTPRPRTRHPGAPTRDNPLQLRKQLLTAPSGADPSAPTATAMNDDRHPSHDSVATPQSLESFLASVEQRAYVMAKVATGDPDSALDIVQESMYRLVDRYSARDPSEWRPLFFTILQSQITDHHRPRGVLGRLRRWFGDADNDVDATDQLDSHQADPADVADADALGGRLMQALEGLPARQRQAFMLRQWQGLSVEQTAEAMGISAGSVKTHLSRALEHLRHSLLEHPQ